MQKVLLIFREYFAKETIFRTFEFHLRLLRLSSRILIAMNESSLNFFFNLIKEQKKTFYSFLHLSSMNRRSFFCDLSFLFAKNAQF
jgi:hypothetical protein